jgi:hypothetical protein
VPRLEWSSHPRRFSCRNVNNRTIPSCRVNLSTASATNESRVFAGVGRERHRWGASCISHAHWRPLPPRCWLLGDEALALLSEVCVDLWRHAGWFEVAFPQLVPPGPAFARAPGLSLSAMRLLA